MATRYRDTPAPVIEGTYRVTGEKRRPLRQAEPAVNAEAAGGFAALALLVIVARCAFMLIG